MPLPVSLAITQPIGNVFPVKTVTTVLGRGGGVSGSNIALDGHTINTGTYSGTPSVSATGLTFIQRPGPGQAPNQYSQKGSVIEFYALAVNRLSGVTITVSGSVSGSISVNLTTTQSNDIIVVGVAGEWVEAFGISGANTSLIFDSNPSLPAYGGEKTVSGLTMQVPGVSTNSVNPFVFAMEFDGDNVAATAGSGFTLIDSTTAYGASQYAVTSLTNSTVAFTGVQGADWAMLVDAVVAATPSAVGSFLVSASSTSPYTDIFGLHVKLQPGHAYNFFIKYTLTSNDMIGSDTMPIYLVANQSGNPIAAVAAGSFISSIPTGVSILAGFQDFLTGLPFFFYLSGSANASIQNTSGAYYQSITTTDFYLTVDPTDSGHNNPGSSVSISSITLEVLDFGLMVV